MAANSAIEWTEATWNPIAGCSIVSPGCHNCYAMRMAARLEAMGQEKYLGTTKKAGGRAVWTGTINVDEEALSIPLMRHKPTTYFVNSMSDLFHEKVRIERISQIFGIMAATPQHTYQVLTKRADRMAAVVPRIFAEPKSHAEWPSTHWHNHDPMTVLPNVWLGFSAEDQKRFDERWPYVQDLARRGWLTWISAEPLLGPIKLPAESLWAGSGLKWAVVGGESGPAARPMEPDWARDIRDQCEPAGLPFFFKQWGEWLPYEESGSQPLWDNQAGGNIDSHAFPVGLTDHDQVGKWWMPYLDGAVFQKVGKRKAGRLLDGREWNEYPKEQVHA